MHLDGLAAKQVDHAIDLGLILLAAGNHERMRRLVGAFLHRVDRLAVVVLHDHGGELRGELERGQHAGLRVVDRVADRPIHFAGGGRHGPVPLPRGLRARQARLLGVGAALVEDFVHPQHAVVVGRGKSEVAGRPHVDEAEVPHARHAVAGELVDLVGRKERQLRIEDRVEIRVLRRLAAERVEQRLRFVQVVPDRRQPVEVPVQVGAQRIDAVIDVAVVVVEHVLAPVGRAAVVFTAVVELVDLVGVVPIDVAIAAVDVGRAGDAHDHVVANLLDVGLVAHGQPVGQLDHRFGRIGFGAVEAGADVIVRLRRRDQLLHLRVGEPARVGQLAHVLPVDLEVLDVRFRRHVRPP